MSDSLSVVAQDPPVDDVEVTDKSETAFSRFGKETTSSRRAYGSVDKNTSNADNDSPSVLGNVMKSEDLLVVDMPSQQPSDSLFANDEYENEDPSDNDDDASGCGDEEENDDKDASDDEDEESLVEDSDDDATVAMEQPAEEEQVSRGRKKRAFRPAPKSNDEVPTPTKEHVEEENATEDPSMEVSTTEQEKVATMTDDAKDPGNDEKPNQQVDDSMAKVAEKEQPDKESLITSIDNLFVHADKNTVTVGDIVRSLQAEYDVKFKKPTKAIVRTHLKDLIEGLVVPTVESMEPASESEKEAEEESDVGDAFDSESSDFEEEVKKAPKKKRKPKKPTKRISPRQKASKKPSHVRIHAEMLRKRRIEELRVRNEELQVKQSKEDQQRAEQIAAKFETDTDELRLKRLEDRLDLLQKLDQKRIRVISDEAKVEAPKEEKKVEATSAPKDDQVPSPALTEDSDSDDDFELEIVGKDESSTSKEPKPLSKVASSGPPVVTKSSAISMLDMVCGLKPTDKKPKRSGKMALTADQPQSSPGKSMTARAALRNSLRAKQRKGANMWLARELGYKNQEEHLRDCMLVEHKKREDVVKREEERLQANERKQLRERMLMESNPYEEAEEEEYNPDEVEGTGENNGDDGNESDEEMAMAREIEEEQDSEEAPEESADVPTNTDADVVPLIEEEKEPQAAEEIDEFKDEQQNESTPSMEAQPESADHDFPKSETMPSDVETTKAKSDGSTEKDVDATNWGQMVDAELNPAHVARREDDTVMPLDTSEPNEDVTGSGAEAPSESVDNIDSAAPTDDVMEHEEANEFNEASQGAELDAETEESKAPKDRNAGWKAMLQKEADKLKKEKARKKGNGLVEAEADEEEEEEVAGLEDFGFSLNKKKKDDDDEDADDDKLTEEDMKHIVDDVSDDEGDEEAGELARKELEQREDKERHKDIIRRMREGYDGRRGGIAGSGVGARGMHRFDQLVAADNREDAKRLGLLNDDELDSDDDEAKGNGNGDDADDDENALLDKMLKDRFLHRSSLEEVEENFSSDDEEEEAAVNEDKDKEADDDDEKEQERLAKRFAKRARMQRLIETHGHDEEFSQLRLIDEDETTRLELKMMKSVSRKSRDVSTASSSRSVSQSGGSDSRESAPVFGVKKPSTSLALGTSSLSLALQASRTSKKKKTSFLGGAGASKEMSSSVHKCVSLGHVVFNTGDSQLSKGGQSSRSNNVSNFAQTKGKRKRATMQKSTSLWSKVSANGFKRRRS